MAHPRIPVPGHRDCHRPSFNYHPIRAHMRIGKSRSGVIRIVKEKTMSDVKRAQGSKLYSLLGKVQSAEKLFLSGRRNREADLESAVMFFLEFLRGFESFDFQEPCVTVFGSARFSEGHPYYELARGIGRELARAGYAVMTGGGP